MRDIQCVPFSDIIHVRDVQRVPATEALRVLKSGVGVGLAGVVVFHVAIKVRDQTDSQKGILNFVEVILGEA